MDSGIDSTESSNGSMQEVVSDPNKQKGSNLPNGSSSKSRKVEDESSNLVDISEENPQGPSVNEHKTETPEVHYNIGANLFPSGCRLHFNLGMNQSTFDASDPNSFGIPIFSSAHNTSLLPYEAKDLTQKYHALRKKCRMNDIYPLLNVRRLRFAVEFNNVPLVEELLTVRKVNPNSVDYRGRTALHIAAAKGYTSIVRLLLDHKADPNKKDSVGNTPLHLAACTSHIETVTLLLKAGTDISQVDNKGVSPYQLARARLNRLKSNVGSSSLTQPFKEQLSKIVELLQTYHNRSGNTEAENLLLDFKSKLFVTDSDQQNESDVQKLLDSLEKLCLKS